MNKLSSEENTVPAHCLKVERWQGPPHINKVKWYEMLLSFRVSLFIQSWQWREFYYFVSLGIKKKKKKERKKQSMKIFLF